MNEYPKICEYCGKKDPGLWRRLVKKEKTVDWVSTNFAGFKYHSKFSRPTYNIPPEFKNFPMPKKRRLFFSYVQIVWSS
jgi:hypothetical protein